MRSVEKRRYEHLEIQTIYLFKINTVNNFFSNEKALHLFIHITIKVQIDRTAP